MNFRRIIKENRKVFFVNALSIGIAFIAFFEQILTSDIVYSMVIGELDKAPSLTEHLASGRYTNYLISWMYRFFNTFGINKLSHQWVLQLFGILIYALAATILYRMLASYMNVQGYSVWLNILVLICFINPFIVETYVYVSFDWAIGVLFAVLSASMLAKGQYIKGGIIAFLAVSTYQTNIVITLLIALTGVYLQYYTELKKLIQRVIMCGAVTAIVAVINLVIPKICMAVGITDNIVKSTDTGDPWSLRLTWIYQNIYLSIVKAYGMLPNYFIPMVLLLVTTIVFVLQTHRYGWNKLWIPVLWIVFVVGMMLLPYVPCFVATYPGFPQRTMLSMFIALAMVMIVSLFFIRQGLSVLKNGYKVLILVVVGALVLATESSIKDCYVCNAMDKYEARCIQEAISEYEDESGMEITTIAVHRPGFIHYTYPEQTSVYVYTLFAHRMFYDSWSDVNLLNYLYGKHYKRIDMDELYTDTYDSYQKFITSHWEGKYWDRLNIDEQIIFDGNTMYWSLY